MRALILLTSFLSLAFALRAETLPPLLCTFGAEAGTVSGRWWKGGGAHMWNRVTAAGADVLLTSDGAYSGVTLACEGELCGAAGVLAQGQFPDRAKDFPRGMTTGAENGYVLQRAGGCAFTLAGLDPRGTYTLYVLAGRGNAWAAQDVATTYAVEGAELLYAENASGAAGLTQNTTQGNWLVFAVAFTGRESVTVAASPGAGNIGAFALVYANRYGKAMIVAPLADAVAPVITTIISLVLYMHIPTVPQLIGIVSAISCVLIFSRE